MQSKYALILLLPVAIVFSACRKSDSTKGDSAKPTALSYTAKMGGVRNWHGSHFYEASGLHYPTPINEFSYYPDTSFAVVVVNDSTIQWMSQVFPYQATDTANQVYFFGTALYYYKYNMGEGVAYFFAKDSIVYCKGDLHGTSDYWKLQNLYYTY